MQSMGFILGAGIALIYYKIAQLSFTNKGKYQAIADQNIRHIKHIYEIIIKSRKKTADDLLKTET